MKLVDILARELDKWPEDALYAWQSECDNEIYFEGAYVEVFHATENAEDSGCGGSEVTRAQWQAAVEVLKAAEDAVPEWNGEGLPPVGIDALLKKEYKLTEGTKLESFPAGTVVYVGGHANFGGCDLAVIIIKGRHFCGTIIPELLEPVRTPEQIAKQERSKACDKMYGVILDKIPQDRRKNGSDICEALYDAGYRKFEIVDN